MRKRHKTNLRNLKKMSYLVGTAQTFGLFAVAGVVGIAAAGGAVHAVEAYETWQLKQQPLIVESVETAGQHWPRNGEGMLRCVACSRMFPAKPGQVQNDRTYCYETAQHRKDL